MFELIKEFGVALLQAVVVAAVMFLPMIVYFGWMIKE